MVVSVGKLVKRSFVSEETASVGTSLRHRKAIAET